MSDQKQSTLSLTAPAPFAFAASAYSHGWVVLAPNEWDEERRALRRVEQLHTGRVVALTVTGEEEQIAIDVAHEGQLSQDERQEIGAKVAHMFRLDEDFSGFYALCRERGEPWRGATRGLGRLLRSPTLFEDVVKTICTTNIQWGGTKRMVNAVVNAYGAPFPGDPGRCAFPPAEAIAAVSEETFAEAVRMGYRAPYVHLLARRVANGELDLEALQDTDLPTPALKKELLSINGVGNYAAATLLMLLGRYDEIAVDTAFRQFVSEKYFGGERPSDAEALAIYDGWGQWKYLAFWLDAWMGFEESL